MRDRIGGKRAVYPRGCPASLYHRAAFACTVAFSLSPLLRRDEGAIWETGAVGARLVTIPISHFCEKARWALDRAGVGYVEQRHLQLIHVAAARLAGGRNTVPVFVTGTGQVLADSSDILLWADTQLEPQRRLYPDGDVGAQARELEAWLDERLGPDGRLWMYHETLPAVRELRRWALA